MNVTQGLRRVLQTNPEGIATVDGERRRSWREIGERVSRLAGGLLELGVKRGDRVAVLMLNSDRYLELYLGIAWAGAVIVPTNIRWSRAEIEDSLRDCRASALVVDKAFAAMKAWSGDAVVVVDDSLLNSYAARVGATATARRIASNGNVDLATGGGLMGYSVDREAMWRRAGYFIDRILKGATPAELPIEQPTTFELVLNKKTAQALGVTFPPSLLLSANRVIE